VRQPRRCCVSSHKVSPTRQRHADSGPVHGGGLGGAARDGRAGHHPGRLRAALPVELRPHLPISTPRVHLVIRLPEAVVLVLPQAAVLAVGLLDAGAVIRLPDDVEPAVVDQRSFVAAVLLDRAEPLDDVDSLGLKLRSLLPH